MLISGEPGIGKSRIAETILERLSGEPHTRVALLLLAPSPGQRALSDHHPARAGGRLSARGHGRATAGQTGGTARPGNQRSQRGRPPIRGFAVDPDRRPLPGAHPHPQKRKEKTLHGAVGAGRGAGRASAGADGVRGRPLERPHHAGVAGPARSIGCPPCGSC